MLGSLASLDVLAILLYFSLLLLVGFYYSRKERTSTEYFLAGRAFVLWRRPFTVGDHIQLGSY